MNKPTTKVRRLAYSVEMAAKAISISRSQLYEEIAAGNITARKVGRRTVILVEELNRFLAAQPVVHLGSKAA